MNYWANSRKVNNQLGGEDSVYVDVDLDFDSNAGKNGSSKPTGEVCFICQGDDTKDCVRIKICCGAPMIHNQCLTDWLNPNTSTGINLKCIYCNSVIRGKTKKETITTPTCSNFMLTLRIIGIILLWGTIIGVYVTSFVLLGAVLRHRSDLIPLAVPLMVPSQLLAIIMMFCSLCSIDGFCCAEQGVGCMATRPTNVQKKYLKVHERNNYFFCECIQPIPPNQRCVPPAGMLTTDRTSSIRLVHLIVHLIPYLSQTISAFMLYTVYRLDPEFSQIWMVPYCSLISIQPLIILFWVLMPSVINWVGAWCIDCCTCFWYRTEIRVRLNSDCILSYDTIPDDQSPVNEE